MHVTIGVVILHRETKLASDPAVFYFIGKSKRSKKIRSGDPWKLCIAEMEIGTSCFPTAYQLICSGRILKATLLCMDIFFFFPLPAYSTQTLHYTIDTVALAIDLQHYFKYSSL
jgi:hypothetical protein